MHKLLSLLPSKHFSLAGEPAPAPGYRMYFIDRNGRTARAKNLHCENDVQAVAEARQAIDGQDVELWQADRMVIRLNANG